MDILFDPEFAQLVAANLAERLAGGEYHLPELQIVAYLTYPIQWLHAVVYVLFYEPGMIVDLCDITSATGEQVMTVLEMITWYLVIPPMIWIGKLAINLLKYGKKE